MALRPAQLRDLGRAPGDAVAMAPSSTSVEVGWRCDFGLTFCLSARLAKRLICSHSHICGYGRVHMSEGHPRLRPSSNNANASSKRLSNIGACNTASYGNNRTRSCGFGLKDPFAPQGAIVEITLNGDSALRHHTSLPFGLFWARRLAWPGFEYVVLSIQ